jgi:hypothetical protein
LQGDFHPAGPLRISLASVSPHVDIDEPTRRRALRERAFEIRQTVFSIFSDRQRKVENEVPLLALLYEQSLVMGATATLDAEVDSSRGID